MTTNPEEYFKESIGIKLLKIGMIIGICSLFVVPFLLDQGIFDDEQTRQQKALDNQQAKIQEQQEQVFADQVKDRINKSTLTCEFVGEIIRENEKGNNSLLSYSFYKDNLRAFWNTNNCGYEWNWWD